MNKPIFNCE